MEAFKIENLSFRYPQTSVDVLTNISFSVNSGEFITLCGPSSCGKSTLLRHLKPSLTPNGVKSGNVFFEDIEISQLSHEEQSQKIGFVMQSPDNQIVTDKVWHELAFGLESLGESNDVIRKRVAETASFFGIQNWFDKSVNELSGGQKQLLNLASIMTMQPSVLILDEPTSQLDPIASADFLACISKINRELGTTIIITEHRLDEVLPLSDRVLVIENGKLISFDTPQKTGENLKKIDSKVFMSLPSPMRIWDEVDSGKNPCPITVAQGRMWLESYAKTHKIYQLYDEQIPSHSEKPSVELDEVWFSYEKNSADVLKGLSFTAYEGEFVAVLGGNGTGKTTMLSIISEILQPYRGKTKLFDLPMDKLGANDMKKVVALPQNPQTLFVKKTVALDLEEVFDFSKISKEEKQKRIGSVVNLCRLENLLSRHPYDLSGGEQQRVALAKVLLLRPRVLLLDEPTKGLDAEFKTEFADIISTLTNSGVTVIMVSHDIEFCAKYPHRCAMMFNGEIVSEATPRQFFNSNSFYATSSNRIARDVCKEAVTVEDVIYCCTNKTSPPKRRKNTDLYTYDSSEFESITKKEIGKLPIWKKVLGVISALLLVLAICLNLEYFEFFGFGSYPQWIKYLAVAIPIALLMLSVGSRSKRSLDEPYRANKNLQKRTVVSAIMILLAIPITIFVGVTYLQNQKFLFISLLVMFECMLPFFLIFEGRKPQARELVIIAVLCALAVVGRVAFFMVPQFKPLIAIVIISGVAFGGESGFLVGAISMLVSNMMFQQGPWTPWQMFGAGIIGFLAGILFKKGFLSRNRISLCIFGFVVTVFVYGVLLNISSVVTSQTPFNLQTILSFCATGFPFDIVHGLSTVVFLYFGAEPILEKLDRVKIKYGLI